MSKKLFPGLQEESLMPKESEGLCKKCKKFKLLGNGYCDYCWDKKTGTPN